MSQKNIDNAFPIIIPKRKIVIISQENNVSLAKQEFLNNSKRIRQKNECFCGSKLIIKNCNYGKRWVCKSTKKAIVHCRIKS